MSEISPRHLLALGLMICAVNTAASEPKSNDAAAHSAVTPESALPPAPAPKPKPDLSGHVRVGTASYYAKKFAGRTMADGNTMDPKSANAASRTLPLGTTAKITNLETGRSAVVTIQDRGPYVKQRIIDLSPSTAVKIGISRADGLAKVEVAPIEVPLPNGRSRPGAAAGDR